MDSGHVKHAGNERRSDPVGFPSGHSQGVSLELVENWLHARCTGAEESVVETVLTGRKGSVTMGELRVLAREGVHSLDLFLHERVSASHVVHGRESAYRVGSGSEVAWLVFPSSTYAGETDKWGRMDAKRGHGTVETVWDGDCLKLRLSQVCQDRLVCLPFMLARPSDNCQSDFLNSLFLRHERLIKADWFATESFSDFWSFWMDGTIYDPRHAKSGPVRFRCEQCSYSWWKYFNWRARRHDVPLWFDLRDIVAESVLKNTESGSVWHHGSWFEPPEVHTRFMLDGGALFLEQFRVSGDEAYRLAARNTASFLLSSLSVDLGRNRIWFMHDTREEDSDFHCRHTLFGEETQLGFVINTHMQAVSFLHSLQIACGGTHDYEKAICGGLAALDSVLGRQSCNALHSVMNSCFEWARSIPVRGYFSLGLQRVLSRLFEAVYWVVQRVGPRIVMPCGFTERDIGLTARLRYYHIGNLKDMLVLYYQRKLEWLRPCIDHGIAWAMRQPEPIFAEWLDVLLMYEGVGGRVDDSTISDAVVSVKRVFGGYSLDACADPQVCEIAAGGDSR